MSRQQLKDAFIECRWCDGAGCLFCGDERRRHQDKMLQPIFTAQRDDPEDMAALKRAFGRDALERAFGPGGRGMREIQENAALESLKQILRKRSKHDEAETK